jgi:hypothetical protein
VSWQSQCRLQQGRWTMRQFGAYPVRRASRRGARKGAMRQLCDDLRRFAIQVRQIGFSVSGGVGERECLDLSERMLAAIKEAEDRMAS